MALSLHSAQNAVHQWLHPAAAMTNAPLAAGLRPCAESCPGVGWRRVLRRGLCPVQGRQVAGTWLKFCQPPSASSLPMVHDGMERVRAFSVHPVRYPQGEDKITLASEVAVMPAFETVNFLVVLSKLQGLNLIAGLFARSLVPTVYVL